MVFVILIRSHLDMGIPGRDDTAGKRTIGVRVQRSEGGDLKRFDRRIDNGTAGGVVVCGRSRRGRQDETVTPEPFDKGSVDAQIEMYRLSQRRAKHDVIDGLYFQSPVLVRDFGFQRMDLLNAVVCILVSMDEEVEFVRLDILKKSQMPRVYAGNGDAWEVEVMHGFQERSVASDRYEKFFAPVISKTSVKSAFIQFVFQLIGNLF